MIQLDQVHFRYGRDGFRLFIDQLQIPAGQRVAVVGPSGCGKTTLLHLLAGIQVPLAGRVSMGDAAVSQWSDHERRLFRISSVGLVFQEFELLDYLNVRENVLLPYRLHPGLRGDGATRERADQLLRSCGLTGKEGSKTAQLSQGERQRVAICRALMTRPRYLLADEPTGNLDPSLKEQILTLLLDRQAESQATLVMVTHDHSLLGRFDRVLELDELASGRGEA